MINHDNRAVVGAIGIGVRGGDHCAVGGGEHGGASAGGEVGAAMGALAEVGNMTEYAGNPRIGQRRSE
ncbi:hypothetical protein G6F22_019122 [Rhizopus arrhizus]|uniref:Uncharacterized protein n=1 Tax=Rhizopus oryzae TaxID=64495 RepID=A0A9P6XL10_RHIOR|nr:hypothetical protein G6F22_019122 [Rhizopus arrhizus]KAG1510968.1 hypothetical protein G6F51_014806 [Rhizopus arrhizus]